MDDELDDIERAFRDLSEVLQRNKPNDRSNIDRYFAIMVTDIEKAYAFYEVYCKLAVEKAA